MRVLRLAVSVVVAAWYLALGAVLLVAERWGGGAD